MENKKIYNRDISIEQSAKTKHIIYISLFIFSLISFSCEKIIEIDPPTNQLVTKTVFEDQLTANAAIAAMYGRIQGIGGFAGGSTRGVSLLSSLSADDLVTNNLDVDALQFYGNSLTSSNGYLSGLWSEAYGYVYMANSILEGLNNSVNLKDEFKKPLMGEAYFIRAFTHFYLVNLFGDVPYVTTTNYNENSIIPRSDVSSVYELIKMDLAAAAKLLPADYVISGGERIRINKFGVNAFQARVYLFLHDWPEAENFSDTVINDISQYSLQPDLNDVFLMNNSEAIWQLKNEEGSATNDGNLFVGSPQNYSLSSDLVESFESGDLRKDKWMAELTISGQERYIPYKYKDYYDSTSFNEYSTVLRLAELFLIRAEARAEQNKLTGVNSAESDINIIRSRAGLPTTTAVTQLELLASIEQERRVEFFTEWGHRWMDLKRTKKAIEILGSKKIDWQNTDTLYAIPRAEILANQNLTQNSGYN